MKIKNLIISMLIVVFGFVVFTGCNANVKLKLNVNSAEGYILCENQEPVYSTATYTFKKKSKVTVNAIANNGYEFNGWTGTYPSNKQDYTFIIKKNANLTANFVKIAYTISLNYNGGRDTDGLTEMADLTDKKIGDSITLPTFSADQNVGNFLGWYYGETKVCDGGNVTLAIPALTATDKDNKSFTLTAKFQIPRTVTFDVDGVETQETYCFGDTISFPSAEKAGHVFLGWFVGDVEYTATTLDIDEDITITAKFAKLYTVSFTGDFEETIEPISTYVGDGEIVLPTVEIEGSTEDYSAEKKFGGWEYNSETYTTTLTFNFNTDITLTAIFYNRYKITYYANGGENKTERFIYQNDYFNEDQLSAPERTEECYALNSVVPTFRCWTYKNEKVTTESQFTAEHDISLIAQWNIYYIKLQYQEIGDGDNLPEEWAGAYFIVCTGDQLMKDIIPYTSIRQANVITSTVDMRDALQNSIDYWSLDPNYEKSISQVEIANLTVEAFAATARTVSADGIDYAGFQFENCFAETFVFVDDYGTPNVTTGLTNVTNYETETVNYAFTMHAVYKAPLVA